MLIFFFFAIAVTAELRGHLFGEGHQLVLQFAMPVDYIIRRETLLAPRIAIVINLAQMRPVKARMIAIALLLHPTGLRASQHQGRTTSYPNRLRRDLVPEEAVAMVLEELKAVTGVLPTTIVCTNLLKRLRHVKHHDSLHRLLVRLEKILLNRKMETHQGKPRQLRVKMEVRCRLLARIVARQ